MERWEYMTFHVTKLSTAVDDLNKLGVQGWEAVAMVSTWGVGVRMVHPMVLLKRPLPEIATP